MRFSRSITEVHDSFLILSLKMTKPIEIQWVLSFYCTRNKTRSFEFVLITDERQKNQLNIYTFLSDL